MRRPMRSWPGFGLTLAVVLALMLMLMLGGCGGGGGGGSDPTLKTLTASASGLTYSLQVTGTGQNLCLTTTYKVTGRGGLSSSQSSHACGAAAIPGHPVLIQARSSRLAMLADAAPGGCPPVRAGSPRAPRLLLTTRCTAGSPQFRVTILPAVRRLLISGVPGAPVINFPRHPCHISVCVTPLA